MEYLLRVATRLATKRDETRLADFDDIYDRMVEEEFFYPITETNDAKDKTAVKAREKLEAFMVSAQDSAKDVMLPSKTSYNKLKPLIRTAGGNGMEFGSGFAEDHIQEAGLVKDDKKAGQYLYMFKIV